MKYLVYDIECLCNCFTITFREYKGDRKKVYVIHRLRNDYMALMRFLRSVYQSSYTLVGFNCIGYDGQLIEYLATNYSQLKHLSGEKIAEAIYEKSQWIIALPETEKWQKLIPVWKFTIPCIDIYRQKHYDGKATRTSLKWLEFTMRMPNIESMPIQHYEIIQEWDEIKRILSYNDNDVIATKKSFDINQFETELRLNLSEKFELDLLNASEPRLARDIFGHKLADAMNMEYRDLRELRSIRTNIRGKDIIFPYVKFQDPMLKGVYDFFWNLEFNPNSFEQNNYNMKKVFKTFPFGNIKEVVVGLGGIHACAKPGVYESNEEWEIIDIDGKSYYPNLGIKNRLYPEHLSEVFCDIYEGLYNDRQLIPKEDPVNYVYKIILNSAYGLSKEANNFFYDPKYTFTITINGQLLLLKLAELMKKNVPGVMFYQFNTDGISIGYHPKYKDKVLKVMKLWEKVTKIELETKLYTKMVIMDVNNYMAIDTKGKVKRKGRVFAYSLDPADKELDYHKNPSALIVPKALEQYFLQGTPVEDYIRECQDIYDFCIGVKIKKDFDLVHYSYNKKTNRIETKSIHEQVCRFYISKHLTALKKKYKAGSKLAGRVVEIAKKRNHTYFNIYEGKPMKDYNIDYQYYIQRAREVIDQIAPNATNLKLF